MAIARALVAGGTVLLCDEPTASLDVAAARAERARCDAARSSRLMEEGLVR